MNIMSQTRHISSHNIMYELSRCNKTIPIFHNARYATNSCDLPRSVDFLAPAADPLAPTPRPVLQDATQIFFRFPERLIDVYWQIDGMDEAILGVAVGSSYDNRIVWH